MSPSDFPSPNPSTIRPLFRDHQLLCLEHQHQRLYVELVDVLEERDLLWVKPLWLVHGPDRPPMQPNSPWDTHGPVDDLRGDSDLLWPIGLFRVALDTEVLALLGGPLGGEPKTVSSPEAQRFRLFIRLVWEAHRAQFSPGSD